MSNKCLIIANGPSSKLIDISSVRGRYDAINSMNASFRTWADTDFRPTHFTALDSVLTKTLSSDIKALIDEGEIDQFFLDDGFAEMYPEYIGNPNVLFLSDAKQLFEKSGNAGLPITTGTWSIRWMIQQGFRNLDIIGMDGIRVELISGSAPDDASMQNSPIDKLKITKTPKFNPNYYSSSYQQEGDKYRVPNPSGHFKNNHIKLHDHALLAVCEDVSKNYPWVTLRDFSTNSTHQLIKKQSFRFGSLAAKKGSYKESQATNVAVTGDCSDPVIFFKEVYQDILKLKELRLVAAQTAILGATSGASKLSRLEEQIEAFIRFGLSGRRYVDRPTIPVVIDEGKLNAEFSSADILNGIRGEAIFEWDIYGEESFSLAEAIQLLPVSMRVKHALAAYSGHIFCDFTGDAQLADAVASLRLAIKDHLFYHRDTVTNSGKNSLSDFERLAYQTLNISFLPEDCDEQKNASGSSFILSDQSVLAVVFKHRYLINVSSIRIHLVFITEPGLSFRVNVGSFSKLSSGQCSEDRIITADNSGKLILSLNMSYADRHIGFTVKLSLAERSDKEVKISPVASSILLVSCEGKTFSRSFVHSDSVSSMINLQSSPVWFNTNYIDNQKRVILIEPDFANKQGHFYAYATNLYKTSRQFGLDFMVLANQDIDLSKSFDLPSTTIKPVFSKNTWTILTSRKSFHDELKKGLDEVSFDPRRDIIYMYTGSVFHALELQRVIGDLDCAVTCSLFWEMIKEVDAREYRDGFNELKECLNGAKKPLSLVSPTLEVAKLAEERLNVSTPLAPHPSTSVHDLRKPDSNQHKETTKSQNQRPMVFFPGVDTMHKGYEFGIQLASRLSEMGCDCYVRDVDNRDKYKSLKYLPLGMTEDEINKWFTTSDLIVVPYMPEGFRSRTSGLAVDALMHGRPLVSIRGTWLSEHVQEYKAGLVIDCDIEQAAQQIKQYLDNVDTETLKNLELSSERYLREHSWESIIRMIMHVRTELDEVQYVL